MWATQVGPDDAVTNISRWAKALGSDHLSEIFADKQLDAQIFQFAFWLFVIYLVGLFLYLVLWYRSKALGIDPKREEELQKIITLRLEGNNLSSAIQNFKRFGVRTNRIMDDESIFAALGDWNHRANRIVKAIFGQTAASQFVLLHADIAARSQSQSIESELSLLNLKIEWLDQELTAERRK
jgi:hypothetical protein